LTIEPAQRGRLLVHGEIDVGSVELLAERVAAEAGPGDDLELDLSDLRFIDISGLWVLHEAAVHLGKAGGTLTLVSPPPSVPKMLDLLGWSELGSLRVKQPAA
jgi:anti-anti-sigma factor